MPSSPLTMRRRAPQVAVVTVAAALLLVGAACADDGGDGATTSTTTSTSTTAPPASEPTTGSTSTEPVEPSRPTAFTTEARDAVNELKAAWEAGDRERARTIAPGDVVDALFPIDPGGFEVYGCDTGEFETSTCSYRNRSSGVYVTVTAVRSEQGWQVSSIFVDGA